MRRMTNGELFQACREFFLVGGLMGWCAGLGIGHLITDESSWAIGFFAVQLLIAPIGLRAERLSKSRISDFYDRQLAEWMRAHGLPEQSGAA